MPLLLVVDDDKALADTMALILRSKAYDVRVASNGREGFELASALHPDLVISDVVMPELNGIEMAIKISQELARTKILLVSGQAATLDLLKEARDRGYDFEALSKPVHPIDLLEKVSDLLAVRV